MRLFDPDVFEAQLLLLLGRVLRLGSFVARSNGGRARGARRRVVGPSRRGLRHRGRARPGGLRSGLERWRSHRCSGRRGRLRGRAHGRGRMCSAGRQVGHVRAGRGDRSAAHAGRNRAAVGQGTQDQAEGKSRHALPDYTSASPRLFPQAEEGTGASESSVGPATGRMTVNRAPPPAASACRISPPCSTTMRCTMARPRPVPSGFVVT